MMRKFLSVAVILLAGFAIASVSSSPLRAAQAAAQSQQPAYTIPEYNAFQAANAEKDPQAQIKLLDDFVSKFPNSTLLPYVYQLYYQAYFKQKAYAKTIEYADKLVALGDKADLGARLQAIQARVQAFSAMPFDAKAADANDQLMKERDAALQGAKLLQQLPKPANSTMTDAQFADQKKPGVAFFSSAAGSASFQVKDYPAAVEAYKTALVNNPNDAVSEYQMGLSFLAMNPPQAIDGFWALARAVNMKIQGADKVKDYLRSKVLAYEQPGCDMQVDAQLNEILQLSANSPERPASYMIPSQDDLNKIRQSSNIITVISDLGGGGDKAKMTWLAICGAEFPEVVGKIIDEQKTDASVDFLVYTGATPEDMQAATMPNMDVKVWIAAHPPAAGASATAAQIPPQPDVVRLQKDDGIRFSGTLESYDPSPFLLHWDQVKVDPTVIPEKGAAAPKGVPRKKTP